MIANETGTDLYAIAATYTETDGTETQVINFFLSPDPVEGVTPLRVPPPPSCLTVDMPQKPYFNPPPDHNLMVGELADHKTGDILAILMELLDADEDAEDSDISPPPAKPPVKN